MKMVVVPFFERRRALRARLFARFLNAVVACASFFKKRARNRSVFWRLQTDDDFDAFTQPYSFKKANLGSQKKEKRFYGEKREGGRFPLFSKYHFVPPLLE